MAKYRATITNTMGVNKVSLQKNDHTHTIEIPPRAEGFGSSTSGGELLFLAVATCYCNDIYREAAKRGIKVERVEVDVDGEFERAGEPATNIGYSVRIKADAGDLDILDLMRYTDQVAEIHNTLRANTPVKLRSSEVID